MSALAVAALSARMLTEAAVDDGFDVVALDLFGDADTRRACSQWCSIGEPASLRIDETLLLPALSALARRGCVSGWIAGSGFEGRPDLLERGSALLPLIGTQAGAVRRVRDAQAFFGVLDAGGVAHPAVRTTVPEDASGWLVKDAHGCGGSHIRRAASECGATTSETVTDHHYFQREVPGAPMSATFIANGRDARVLGFNQLIVRPLWRRPFVFCGAMGPVPLPASVGDPITAAVRMLARAFSLRGLGSLDFMLDGDACAVLEVNPRPPASLALYRGRNFQAASKGASTGVVTAHVRACLEGELPQPTAPEAGQATNGAATDLVHGTEIVFSNRPLWLNERAVRWLAERAGCHDQPAAATRIEAGHPLCSVSASGASAEQVRSLLERGRAAVHQSLEIPE